jgi:subtilase family serine protease
MLGNIPTMVGEKGGGCNMRKLFRIGVVLGLLASMLLVDTLISPLSIAGAGSAGSPVSASQSIPDPTPPIIYRPISGPTQGPGLSPNIVSGAYTPANIRAAYNFGALASSSNVHIAIVDAYGDPNLSTDLAIFNSTFGLPVATVNIYTPNGTSGSNSGWALETALDVEWAHACAPNATIDLVIARSNSWTYLISAINYAVGLKTRATNPLNVVAISMSFGGPESGGIPSGGETAFASALAAGIVPVASSGDNGAYDGTPSLTPEYPASSPQVLSVGGTSLTLSGGGYGSETAWSGSGGGYSGSSFFAEPPFQTGAAIPDATARRGVGRPM